MCSLVTRVHLTASVCRSVVAGQRCFSYLVFTEVRLFPAHEYGVGVSCCRCLRLLV